MWRRSVNTTSVPQPFAVPVTGKFEGNDGKWSTFMINIGVPTGQNFRVLVSTASSISWVPGTAGCTTSDPSDCPQLRGVENFAGAQSQGYDPQESQGSNQLSSSIGLYGLQLGTSTIQSVYGANYSGINATVYSDVEGLGPYSSTTPEIAGEAIAAVASKALFMGSLGLNVVPNNFGSGDLATFLTQYANSSQGIPSTSYGYSAGASYRSGNFYGSLVLGGYDSSRFTPATHSYSLTSTNHSIALTVQSILVDIQGNSQSATLDTSDDSHMFPVRIDSTLPYLWLPSAVCDRFESIFGLTYDKSTDLYTINQTSHQNNLNTQPTITFKLAESPASGNTTQIVLPYSAFDQQASWPIYTNATNYFPIRRSPTGVNVLGRSFLQEAYLIVDYDRQNFSIAQATFPPSVPTPRIVPILRPATQTRPQKSSSSFPAGAIAGIVVGIFLVAVAILAYFLFKRRQRQRKPSDATSTNGAESGPVDAVPTRPPLPGRASVFSEGDATVTSELPSELPPMSEASTPPARGYYGKPSPDDVAIYAKHASELATPEEDIAGYFKHRRIGSSETAVSELEVKPQVHELPADTPKKETPQHKSAIIGDSEPPEKQKAPDAPEDAAPPEDATPPEVADGADQGDESPPEPAPETPPDDQVGSPGAGHGK